MKKTIWITLILALLITPSLAESFSVVRLPQKETVSPVGNVYLLEEGEYRLSGSTQRYMVYAGGGATLVLDGAEMDLSEMQNGTAPIRVQNGAEATLVLAQGSRNVLKAAPGAAAVQAEGALVIRCAKGEHSCGGSCGSLEARGGAANESTNAGAGIGGGRYKSSAPITIMGGRVSAYGGSDSEGLGGGAAGIGAGSGRTLISPDGEMLTPGPNTANGSNITITGGVILAQGGAGAAGIGGGDWGGKGTNIHISGGNVTAYGGAGASGIGGGFMGSAQNIRLSGAAVQAFGGEEASGIGGGYAESGKDIVISGGWVRATAGAQYDYPRPETPAGSLSPVNDAIGSGAEAAEAGVQLAPQDRPMAVRFGQSATDAAMAENSPFDGEMDLTGLLDDAGFVEIRAQEAPVSLPATGDHAQPFVWFVLMTACFWNLWVRRRQKEPMA